MSLKALCRNGATEHVEPGIHVNMPRSMYDKIPALSASVLKKWLNLREIPSEFKWWLKDRWEDTEVSESILLGLALDCMKLESRRFGDSFAVIPNDAPPKRTRKDGVKHTPATLAAMEWWDRFNTQNSGKRVLTSEQYEKVCLMSSSLDMSPVVKGVFDNCVKVSLVGTLWGFPCKSEIDLWNAEINHILDLKTSWTVEPGVFTDTIRKYQYLEQAVFYLSLARALGFDKEVFSFIAVKSSAPWTVKVSSFSPKDDITHKLIFDGIAARLEQGAEELVGRLNQDAFVDSDEWGLIDMPSWYVRNLQAERRLM